MKTRKLVASVALLTLVGCGGGGGGETTPAADTADQSTSDQTTSSSGTSEGFWTGPTSTGYTANVAVLETGETWGIYSSGSAIYGALFGQTSSSNGTLSGSGSDFNIPAKTLTPGTYTGSYTPKSSISINTSLGTSFTGAYVTSYDTPASLTAVTGTFTGTGVTLTTTTTNLSIGVSSQGVVTMSAGGCSASGTATPRPTGKNIFNVSVTFSGATCALGNGVTATGVGFYNATTKQVMVMALNPAKSNGFLYVGTKP